MKKLLSIAIVCVMLLSAMTAYAAAPEGELPFPLVAPGNVTAVWCEGGDSPTTTNITYSLSNEMTAFFREKDAAQIEGKGEEFLSKYPFDDIWITTQVDWAVDDVNDSVSGWHCNEYWNCSEWYGFGYDDEGNSRVGAWDGVDLWVGNATETINDHWVTRAVNEDEMLGNPETKTPGLKDQMRPDQYEYKYDADGDGALWIDYTEHTVYFRMRFVVTTVKEGEPDQYYYSDWSNIAAVGKNGETNEPLTKDDLKAPEITDLHMTDKTFNDNPVVAFTLTVPEELMKNASKVAARGGTIRIETEARVKGDTEWTEMGNTDSAIQAGEMECALLHLVNNTRPSIPKDTVIELRCRYWCSQPGVDDFWSDYSKVISFGTNDINQGGSQGADAAPDHSEAAKPAGKTCPICHFCPQPLGLCIFIWLLIILVIAAIVFVVLRKKKNRENK